MIELKEIRVGINDLLLDPNNPRFSKHKEERVPDGKIAAVQERTLETMINGGFDVPQLAENIKKNGYLGFDRLFVKSFEDKYIVIEGNRRVSAVKLLIKLSENGTSKTEISESILRSFNSLPAIDVSDLTEDQIRFLLGRRHFDSVKDWRPLPASYHLFTTYMEYLIGSTEKDADDIAEKYIHDPRITKQIAELYDMKDSDVKALVQTYRLYLQIISEQPSAADQSNIFSMISEIVGTPKLRERFGFDIQLATLSPLGLERCVMMIIQGKNGEEPIIQEVAKGDRSLRDYIKVLKEGSSEDIDRIEIERAESSDVAAEIKNRKTNRSLKRILGRMAKDLEEIQFGSIRPEDVTQADFDVIEELMNELSKLLGTVGRRK